MTPVSILTPDLHGLPVTIMEAEPNAPLPMPSAMVDVMPVQLLTTPAGRTAVTMVWSTSTAQLQAVKMLMRIPWNATMERFALLQLQPTAGVAATLMGAEPYVPLATLCATTLVENAQFQINLAGQAVKCSGATSNVKQRAMKFAPPSSSQCAAVTWSPTATSAHLT